MDRLLLENKYRLAWTEYGEPNGEPVFYFHGAPGSRLEAKSADSIARYLGIRLIATDRPGYGDSDLQENFRHLDWPAIIVQLADKLNIRKFSILGFSAGGAFALACAHEIPERVKHITLISSSASYDTNIMRNSVNKNTRPFYEISASDHNSAVEQVSQLATTPEALLKILEAPLCSADAEIINDKQIRKQYLNSLSLAISKGVNGFVQDLGNLALPWNFKLENIETNIDIWHGRSDKTIGFAVSEYLADTLKNNSTHFLDNKGHLFIFKQWHEILLNIKNKIT